MLDGKVYAFGSNEFGQCGIGEGGADVILKPTLVKLPQSAGKKTVQKIHMWTLFLFTSLNFYCYFYILKFVACSRSFIHVFSNTVSF